MYYCKKPIWRFEECYCNTWSVLTTEFHLFLCMVQITHVMNKSLSFWLWFLHFVMSDTLFLLSFNLRILLKKRKNKETESTTINLNAELVMVHGWYFLVVRVILLKMDNMLYCIFYIYISTWTEHSIVNTWYSIPTKT